MAAAEVQEPQRLEKNAPQTQRMEVSPPSPSPEMSLEEKETELHMRGGGIIKKCCVCFGLCIAYECYKKHSRRDEYNDDYDY